MPIKSKHRLGGISKKCFLLILWGACLLSLSPYAWSQESTEWKLRVSAMSASIRLKPDPESPVIATLPKGTSFNSYEAEGDWFRVVLPPGKDGIVIIGYIAKSEVQIVEEKIKKQADFWQVEEGGFKGLGFHLMLSGGVALFPSGDIDRGAKGLYNIGAEAIAARGVDILERNTKPLRSALNLSGDIIYDLGPKIGIGIGFGYIHTLGVDTFRYSERKVYENTMNSATDLTVVTFRLGAFYALPLGRRFLLRLNAGPAIFITNLNYNRNAGGLDFEESYSLIGKTTNLGFQGGARLEIRIVERASLFFEVQGRTAKISDFQGSEHWVRKENLLTLPTVETIDKSGALYYLMDNPYPRLAVFPEGSSDAHGAQKAVFDFTGADLLAGIHIRF
jgi:hypothetical protein